MAIILNWNEPADIEIRNCLIARNFAAAGGGGVYAYLEGVADHRIRIRHTRFRRNRSLNNAGGLGVQFIDRGVTGRANRVEVLNSEFSDNVADYGGGAYFLPIRKCTCHMTLNLLHRKFIKNLRTIWDMVSPFGYMHVMSTRKHCNGFMYCVCVW